MGTYSEPIYNYDNDAFLLGDLVRITSTSFADLHNDFLGRMAIVYGKDKLDRYQVWIPGSGKSTGFSASDLTLLKPGYVREAIEEFWRRAAQKAQHTLPEQQARKLLGFF